MEDGRRVTIGARVSERMAADIDRARGTASRSAWVEQAIREALHAASKVPGGIPVSVIADDRVPRGTAALVGPGLKPGVIRNVTPGIPCSHPKARVIKGYCGACGTGGLS
jgi:hypothetical protein